LTIVSLLAAALIVTFWPSNGALLDVRYLNGHHANLRCSHATTVAGFSSATNVVTFTLQAP
jgi:hypothetical protein